jgi:DNA-binding XRE family transcriptional regulator
MRNQVREQRAQREMSQAELAAALGVSRLTVDKMFDPEEEAGT